MTDDNSVRWLDWAREIQAISQTGMHYSQDEYHRMRFERLIEIAAEIIGDYTEIPVNGLKEDFLNQKGYATPKVDVRGAVIRDGKILLVQDAHDGLWCMPGGWADIGAAPSKMVEREVWEESGFCVHARKVVGIFEGNRDHPPLTLYYVYKIVFLCDIVDGEARPSIETTAVKFFPLDDLPPFSSARTNQRHINEVLEHVKNPDRLPFFD